MTPKLEDLVMPIWHISEFVLGKGLTCESCLLLPSANVSKHLLSGHLQLSLKAMNYLVNVSFI